MAKQMVSRMFGVNPLNHPICFAEPARMATCAGDFGHGSAWIGHVPFGMYLIDLLRPRAFAELGTNYGVSYCAFCQAVKELGLDTRCYAIDTWQEDLRAGFDGPEVLSDLEEHHNPLYGSFSRLIKSTADEALSCFADNTLDLLQIEGYHSSETVRADFEKWLPKMTDRGVVLFHDIKVRERDLGVSKFWDELKLQYPSFEFEHSHGLGVLAVGHDYPEELNALLHCSEAEALSVRRFFSNLGAQLEAVQELKNVKSELEAQAQQITELKQDLKDRDLKLQNAALQMRRAERRTQELAGLLAGVEDIRYTGSYRLVRALSAPLRWKYRMTLKRYIQRVNSLAIKKTLARINGQSIKKTLAPSIDRVNDLLVNKWLSLTSTGETALFDAEWYLSKNPDVAQAKLNPLLHYLRLGANEGRAPHPLFDPKFYLKTYPEAAISGGNALEHYLTQGWKKGYKPNPRFDPSFYLEMYPDVAEAGCEPLTHFAVAGLREGRSGCLEEVYLEPFAFEAEFEIPREPTPGSSTFESDVKAIAFYLPQFHPIPENDEWWGTGFTEWTNVRRGEPQFTDHHQPHVPSDLGYYDLREIDMLERQVALAQEYGIYGFCLYYYWFAGKILLDLPIRGMLERGKPDFPFCICWANENWTRRWDGQENDILIAQQHSPEDDLAFLQNIESVLLHKNYIRVEGKPLLIVYQPSLLPNAQATAARWREAFRARGHGELFLASAQTFDYRSAPNEYGFDAGIQFPPHTNSGPITRLAKGLNKSFSGHIYDYNQTKWSFIYEFFQLSPSRLIYPGVMPSWDNTARRQKRASIWINSSPESYYDWLRQITSYIRRTKPHDEKFVFINAWNEWAEGCHLEPDQNFGYAWLNATRLGLQSEEAATD